MWTALWIVAAAVQEPPDALGQARFRHLGRVRTAAASADGKWIASACAWGDVRVWDAAGAEAAELRTTVWPRAGIALRFSPDSTTLLVVGTVGDDDVLYEWSPGGGWKERFKLPAPLGLIAAFSADARRFAFQSNDWRVHVADAESGKLLRSMPTGGRATSLALSSDGTSVAVGFLNRLRAWDVATEKVLLDRACPRDARAHALAFDGPRLVVGTDDRGLWLLDPASDVEKRADLPACPDAVALTESRVVVGNGHGLVLVDLRSWTIERKIGFASAGSVCMARQGGLGVSPDGRRVAFGLVGSNAVARWDVETGTRLPAGEGHEADTTSLAFSEDGRRLVSGGADATSRLWDVRAGKELRVFRERAEVRRVALSPDASRFVVVTDDDRLLARETAGGMEIVAAEGVADAAILPDGGLAAILLDGRFARWDREGTSIATPARLASGKEVSILGVLPDGLVCRAAGGLQEWTVTADGPRAILRDVDAAAVVGRELFAAGLAEPAPEGWAFSAMPEALGSVKAVSGDLRVVAMMPSGDEIAFVEAGLGKRVARTSIERSRCLAFVPGEYTVAVGTARGPIQLRRLLKVVDAPGADDWALLGSEESPRAFEAMARLAAKPAETLPAIRERLLRGLKEEKAIRAALEDLGDARVEVRERAVTALRGLDIRPLLEEVGAASPDVLARIAELKRELESARRPAWKSGADREIDRAVQVLELIGSPASLRILRELSEEAPSARVKVQAGRARKRLGSRL